MESVTAYLDRLENESQSIVPPAGGRREEQHSDSGSAQTLPGDHQEMMEPNENPLLQEELGCMFLHASGKFRPFYSNAYHGAEY